MTVRIPNARLEEAGFDQGIVLAGDKALDLQIQLTRELDGDFFENDLYKGVGRVFPMYYEGDHGLHPKLHFLVFDPEKLEWYLSCGGMRYCWWCQSDRQFAAKIRHEQGLNALYSSFDDGCEAGGY